MHRRTNNYFDLLPLDADREQALKLRLEDQHRMVIDEMRSGTLHLPPLPPEPPPRNRNAAAEEEARHALAVPAAPPTHLKLELVNGKTWLTGKQATLQILVRDPGGNPLQAALVSAHVEGAGTPEEFAVRSGPDGHARLQFEMPRLIAGEAALVIEASQGDAHGQLRFSLRARPKVPAAG
jgi:hypothetical protein